MDYSSSHISPARTVQAVFLQAALRQLHLSCSEAINLKLATYRGNSLTCVRAKVHIPSKRPHHGVCWRLPVTPTQVKPCANKAVARQLFCSHGDWIQTPAQVQEPLKGQLKLQTLNCCQTTSKHEYSYCRILCPRDRSLAWQNVLWPCEGECQD